MRGNMKVRKVKITVLLFILISIVVLLGNITLGAVIYTKAESALTKQVKDNVINIAGSSAASIDGADFKTIDNSSDEAQEEYKKIYETLAAFRDNTDIEYIYTFRVDDNVPTYVIDSDTEEPADYGEELDMSDGIEGAMKGEPTTDSESLSDEWGEHLSAYAPIYDGDEIVGFVGIDISMDWMNNQIAKIRNIIIMVCVCSYIVAFMVIVFFAVKLSKSFKVLNNKIEDLNSGDGDLTRNIEIRSGDEFETIANNINVFLAEIRNLVSGVSDTLDDLRINVNILDENVTDNKNIISNMDTQIVTISSNMEECSASSDIASDNLKLAANQVQSFANEVGDIQEMASEANASARESEKAIIVEKEEATNEIARLQEKIREASVEAEKINEVKEIAERITAIASQTRLLSLNAQIEAARAGEQGAGFAVVATQVGELSNEIEIAVAQINRINSEVSDAMQMILNNSDEINKFMEEKVLKDYDAFANLGQEYGDSTNEIRMFMNKLKADSDEISAMLTSIYQGVSDINIAVADSANNAGELAESSANVAGKTGTLKELSEKNAKDADNLKERISRYKY